MKFQSVCLQNQQCHSETFLVCRGRGPQESRAGVCTLVKKKGIEKLCVYLKDALVVQQPRQERRLRATVMLVDSVLKKRWRQKRKGAKGTVRLFCENRCSHQPQQRRQQLQQRRQRQTTAAASSDAAGSKHACEPPSSLELLPPEPSPGLRLSGWFWGAG